MSRARTWIKRVALGLGAVIVLAVTVVLITLHTDFGRELIRKQVEARLNDTFVGGGSIASIEGSPFGDLRLNGIVLNGPDGKPAVTIGSLKLRLGLLPLVSKQARIAGLEAQDVDVILKRDPDGLLQISRMMRPAPKSGWSIDIPDVVVRRGHVAFDTGGKEGVINLDELTIFGAVHMLQGKPLDANVSIRGSWRERAAGIGVDAVVSSHEGVTSIPSVTALLGGVTVAGSAIRIVAGTPDSAPMIDGMVVVNAPAAAVTQLVPEIKLPADVAVAVTAYSQMSWTQLSLIGNVGATPVRAMLSADLARRRAMGVVSSGDLDLAMLSQGKLTGHGGAVVIFDGAMGRAGELPVASGVVTAWGDLLDVPHAQAAIAFSTDGERASTVVGLHGDSVTAMLAADIKRIGEAITLERSTLIASTSNPARASGGKAPVRGALDVRLAVSGALSPAPNLAVTGRVKGKRLRAQGLSVATLDLAIDAKNLPNQPRGKAELRLTDLVRNDQHLGLLEVDAANREDGKIAVAVRSRPKQNPWLLDVDALVTPPGRSKIVAIEIVRHHLRAGNGGDWRGTSGHIEIGPDLLLVRELESAGESGKVAIAATLARAGRNEGDLVAKIDATGFALDTISTESRGIVDAHVDVSRTNNKWAGAVDVKAKGIAADSRTVTLDADVHVQAQADKLVIAATAASAGLGSASFAVDVDAPKDVANVEMWKHLHRDVIRVARVSFTNVDLGKVAELAGKPGALSGRLDGDVQVNATTASGAIRIRDVMAPALRGTGGLNADLRVTQTAADELSPVLTGTIGGIGNFEVITRVGAPEHLFDPDAWKALGAGVVRGATAKVENVMIEPGLLDRLGLSGSDLRGRASFTAEVSEAMRSVHAAVELRELRGTPIAEPVQAHFAVAIDDKSANTSLSVRAQNATLLEMRGTVPVTMDQLRADPRAVLALPLDLTATIPKAPAPTVLNVFGRSEITGGTIDGTIKVAGTVGKPTLTASIVGTMLAVPPGLRHKPVKTLEKITVDATWDGVQGKVAIKGKQQDGMLDVVATGSPRRLEQGRITIVAKAFDLIPLLVFAPGPAGSGAGRLDANLTVDGLDPHTAKVAGDLHLTGARIPIAPSVGTLRRAKVDIVIGASTLKIKIDGRLGGGTVKLDSTIALSGAQPTHGDATVTLRKISPIGTIEPDIDADIKIKMVRDGNKWTADVLVHNGVVKVPKARGEKLKPVGAPSDMTFASGGRVTARPMLEQGKAPAAPTLVANITLYSTYVESAELRGIIKGNLTVSADAETVGIVGKITADRGDLDLFGRRYQVERAAVRFDGSTDPLLDLMISHDFTDVTTITQVRGRLSKPELVMSSNPGMYSQGQLLGFLLGGEPSGDPQSGSARDQVTGAGASIIANKIGGYVRNALPVDIDVLRYEGATAGSSAAVTVGTWLSRSLFVAYRRHLEARPGENTGEGEAEYWLSRRVMLEAIVGDRGYNGIDLLWRKRY